MIDTLLLIASFVGLQVCLVGWVYEAGQRAMLAHCHRLLKEKFNESP